MGAVYRAYDSRLDRRVAVKRILASYDTRSPRSRKRFLREARLAAQLSHPAIVQVHDLVAEADQHWIVMELVDGSSLSELLLRGPLPIPRTLELGREIAEGLDYAHRRGTIHRDLKAENVMVTSEGHAKILDFGLAKRVLADADDPSLTAAGTVLGTLHAMSPEQAQGLDIDARSDLFSLGTMLYEMASGEQPFLGKTPIETLTRVCTHRLPPLDRTVAGAPPSLAVLIEELHRKEPSRRPASAAEVAQRLAGTRRDLHGSSAPGASAAKRHGADVDPVETREATPPSTRLPSPAAAPASPVRATPLRRFLPALGAISASLVITLVVLAWTATGRDAEKATPGSGTEGATAALETRWAGVPIPELIRRSRTLLETYYRKEDLATAIAMLERVLVREPESAAAYAGLSRAYWRRYYAENRDPLWLERAVSHGLKAVELDEHLAFSRISLALALVPHGQLDDAERQARQVLTLDPDHPDAHRVMAEVHLAGGRLDAAEKALRTAIAVGEDADLHDVLGGLLTRTGRLEEAAEHFRRSIELAPDSVAGYRNLAGIHYFEGQLAEAARTMQRALEVRQDPTLYTSLGILYFAQGLYQEATPAFEKAVELSGGAHHHRLWGNLADAYRWLPDHSDQARDAYLRAIQLLRPQIDAAPEDLSLRSQLALFLAKRGDAAAAREELATIKEAGANAANPDAAVHYRIAVALEILGGREGAIAELGDALKAGYPLEDVRRDPELTELRADVEFHRLLVALDN